MGCGLCAPKASRYKSSSVSPSATSVGKALSGEVRRPDTWRAREAEAPLEGSPGPRAAAEADEAPEDSVELPGMPEDTQMAEIQAEATKVAEATSVPKEKNAGEDSSDESVDEHEMEAALRAVAEVLTPRRNSEAKLQAPKPPPKVQKAPKATRPLYEITSPLSKPQVEFPKVNVSTSTQLMLLTWARWGRNSWRIKQEEHIKSLQHKRFPRAPPVHLSPQPTPRAQAESAGSAGSSPGTSPGNSPGGAPRTGAAAWRAGGELGMGTTVHSREGGSPGRAYLAELREEQRDSMAEQGTRARLTRGLGGGAAQAHSLGTPGFGVDTPGFPGGSGAASADASVASSGVASPVKGGQMSPWILEAEALCEVEEEATAGGWGLEPETDALLALEKEIFGKAPERKESVQKEEQPVLDEDELERVEMFEESPSKKSEAMKAEELQEAPAAPQESPTAAFEYVVGERVSYYSSHRSWMPARVVERKSRSVYVIDKQLRGCLAKVKASELVSEKEERSNPVLRAFTMLEKAERKRPSSASSTRASSKASPLPSPVTVGKGRIVRDDFSDDSDS